MVILSFIRDVEISRGKFPHVRAINEASAIEY